MNIQWKWVAIIVIAFVYNSVTAQKWNDKPHQKERRDARVLTWLAELELSPEQRKAVYDLHRDIKRSKHSRQEKRHYKIKHRHDRIVEEMKSILDDQQYALYLEKVEERTKKRQEWKMVKEKMREYKISTIDPVLDQQRIKLESVISDEGRVQIEKWRSQVASARRRPLQAQRATISALVDKYAADIDRLLEEITPQREIWKAEMQQLRSKFESEGEPGYNAPRGPRPRLKLKGKRSRIAFLLRQV